MNNISVVKYLLSASEQNYLDSIKFISVEPDKIVMDALVRQKERVRPIAMMIEANMYTRKELLAKNVTCNNDSLCIQTFNGISYVINVKEASTKKK